MVSKRVGNVIAVLGYRMCSTRNGNLIAAAGFALLSAVQFIVFVGGAKLLAMPDQGPEVTLFRLAIPLIFTFASVPFLRKIGADYALAAGICTAAFFAFTYVVLNGVIITAIGEKWTLNSTIQSLGPIAGLLIVVLLHKALNRMAGKPIVLIPTGVLIVWLVDQGVQMIMNLAFRYLA